MKRVLGLEGNRYGMWTVLSKTDTPTRPSKWLCVCDCGTTKEVNTSSLRTGGSTSCGCARVSAMVLRNTLHGKTNTREFNSWASMVARCVDPAHQAYRHYGGRGITVCAEWQSFSAFFKDMGLRPEGTSLDRIDNNGNYCAINCRWATKDEQDSNKRNTVFCTVNGVRKPVSYWAKKLGISHSALTYRLSLGMPVEDACTLKPTQGKKLVIVV